MYYEMAIHLFVAFLLGAVIGFERQWRQRFTGVVTHALVAIGATTFATLPFLLGAQEHVVRMAAQVVTGIGFLGAGVIMRDGVSVRGLSTAATVWCTGAVGVMAGCGFLGAAVLSTTMIVLCNLSLPYLARWVYRVAPAETVEQCLFEVEIVVDSRQEALVRSALLLKLNEQGLALQSLESHSLKGGGKSEVNAVVLGLERQSGALETLVGELALAPYVSAVCWSIQE
jgi:putative Mg2+ transporter-C (MgtC) family protein